LSLRGKYTSKLVLGTSEPRETHLTTRQQLELNISLFIAYTGLGKALIVQEALNRIHSGFDSNTVTEVNSIFLDFNLEKRVVETYQRIVRTNQKILSQVKDF